MTDLVGRLLERATQLEALARELRSLAREMEPPCGRYLDGHSDRKCGRRPGHDGECS